MGCLKTYNYKTVFAAKIKINEDQKQMVSNCYEPWNHDIVLSLQSWAFVTVKMYWIIKYKKHKWYLAASYYLNVLNIQEQHDESLWLDDALDDLPQSGCFLCVGQLGLMWCFCYFKRKKAGEPCYK